MNTPPDLLAWRQLQAHAAAQLPGDFADRVLRAARLVAGPEPSVAKHIFLHPFAVSTYTAAACFVAVVMFHTRNTEETSAQHLTEWLEVTMQTASLDPL